MQIQALSTSSPTATASRAPQTVVDEALPPSVAVRCGAAETAAIIDLLDNMNAARQAVEAWDGVSRDHRQRLRQKYARLLADLYQRHPEEVLAGLRSPQSHTRIWIALAIVEAPSAHAVPALELALAGEPDVIEKRALGRALLVCKMAAASEQASDAQRPA